MATCAGCVPPGTGCALEASPLLCPPLPEMFFGGSLSRLWGALCNPWGRALQDSEEISPSCFFVGETQNIRSLGAPAMPCPLPG